MVRPWCLCLIATSVFSKATVPSLRAAASQGSSKVRDPTPADVSHRVATVADASGSLYGSSCLAELRSLETVQLGLSIDYTLTVQLNGHGSTLITSDLLSTTSYSASL